MKTTKPASGPKRSPSDYELKADGRFLIRDYERQRPFSNFLPGIAGLYGTPMWAFFVNRGQGISSFGTRNKDSAILEFFPANKAYQATSTLGFRTFLKIGPGPSPLYYEPFKETSSSAAYRPERSMEIGSEGFSVREVHRKLGLETVVRYFTVPGEPIAALSREVRFTNLTSKPMPLEVLDGLPAVNPYGMNEFFVKHMSRTIEAWMMSENVQRKAPFLKLRVDATDRPEVTLIHEGNFFFGFLESAPGRLQMMDPAVDPAVVFGPRLDFGEPQVFLERTPYTVPAGQVQENKTPCAFLSAQLTLGPGKSASVRSYFGQAGEISLVNRFVQRAKAPGYQEAKAAEAKRVVDEIKARMFTVSGSPAYDLYCGQTFLDNVMRGGLPVYLGGPEGGFVFHVYSRKHGDPERDYNRFLVEPTYFSQGDGNYRDVNQNRRSDVWFEPRVRDANIRTFLNLLQLDGFNPLVIKGALFVIRRSPKSQRALEKALGRKEAAECMAFGQKPFGPGDLYRFLEQKGLGGQRRFESLLADLAPYLDRQERAEHGEGFWVDHWTYNLDLIENYLGIFPEDARGLLFGRADLVFHDSDHTVRPRSEKYVLDKPGHVRQFGAVAKDPEKAARIKSRAHAAHVVRSRGGRGDIYRTTLFVKLLCLFANKAASLDPQGIGVEMEAEKPSWYDALNGLPGLLGSSLCETFELKRLAVFLIQAVDERGAMEETVALPVELHGFIERLDQLLEKHLRQRDALGSFPFWDAASAAREDYRRAVRHGVSGQEKKATLRQLKVFLEHAREKIDLGIERAYDPKSGLYPTYFENRVTRYQTVKVHADGRPRVKALAFEQSPLPHFLEGPVHAMKVERDPQKRRQLFQAVRRSRLFDPKLGMYKVNAPLEGASLDIGRARVFAPGWLENESIWLHMEYKFLLEVLKAGMPEEFFEDFRRALIPFQPAERYGRSVLENSSFLVSSAFGDASLHGTGFVARLSGSTAEFLSIWLLMNVGKKPFYLSPEGKLSLRFEPLLPQFLFTKAETEREYAGPDGKPVRVKVPKDSFAFLFLGKTLVVYHNPRGLDTYGRSRVSVKKVTLTARGGKRHEFRGDTLPAPYAAKVRDEQVPRIDIELG